MGQLAAELRDTELFAELDEPQLAWLAEVGFTRVLADGEVLFREGAPAEAFYVLLDGELIFTTELGAGRQRVLTRHVRGAAESEVAPGTDHDDKPAAAHHFTGEMPLLCGAGNVATATAVGRTRLVGYPKERFFEMLSRCPQVCRVLLPVLAWRIHLVEVDGSRRATLSALGTLAMGLAHELNNPAAAVVRAAAELAETLPELVDRVAGWDQVARPEERRLLSESTEEFLGVKPNRLLRNAFEIAARTDELTDWLADNRVDDPDRLAAELADHDIGLDRMTTLARLLRPDVLRPALECLAELLRSRYLVAEIVEAGQRISALVDSARAYSNLNRAPVRETNLVDGIEATLTMLATRLAAVTVRRDYAAEVPALVGHPSELHQVWTNLIDNAVDAMAGRPDPELRISIRREGDWVVVEIRDNGAGIPPEIQPRLFQPFFTTKEVGRGTGLGLHLVLEIVENRHNGSIGVASEPGDTRIAVRLPINLNT